MESHIAAAEAHGLPFAACGVIIDPAHRVLPPAALVNLRPDGTPDIAAVLRSVIRQPYQLPALLCGWRPMRGRHSLRCSPAAGGSARL
jgi:hypothetical protein